MIAIIYGVYHRENTFEPLYIGSSDRKTLKQIWNYHKNNAYMERSKIGTHLKNLGLENFFISILKKAEYNYNRTIKADVLGFKKIFKPKFNIR